MAGSGAVEGFALAAALSSIRLTISVAWCKIIVGDDRQQPHPFADYQWVN